MRHHHEVTSAAQRFLLLSGRLLERARFAHLFAREAGAAARVLAALQPYQNDDGGFGQILEPDFRGPVSQPLCVDAAFRVLDELDADVWTQPLATRALSYLQKVSAADGGVPNVARYDGEYPRAPWWVADPRQPGSLLPTASLAGHLYRHHLQVAWLEGAARFTWAAIARLPARIAAAHERLPLLQALYEARAVVLFLDHTPERSRAEQAAAELGRALQDKGVFTRSDAEQAGPLDYAASPDSLARRWFDDTVIARELEALAASQAEDGGFPITWQVWTPLAGSEWRGIQTLERLKTLRAYGRLD